MRNKFSTCCYPWEKSVHRRIKRSTLKGMMLEASSLARIPNIQRTLPVKRLAEVFNVTDL